MKSLPGSVDATLAELRETLASVSSESALQQQLLQTVTELDRTLQSLRDFLELLDEQPNALIFNRAAGKDPQPPAGSP
jgi:paraquat-inducible protein B